MLMIVYMKQIMGSALQNAFIQIWYDGIFVSMTQLSLLVGTHRSCLRGVSFYP